MGRSSRLRAALDRAGFLRTRSLLWLIPERAARWVSWLVVLVACAAPAAVLIALALSRSVEKQQESLAALLSERLSEAVRLHITRQDAPGQYHLSGITVGGGDAPRAMALQAPKGSYDAPQDDLPGRLDLEDGTLRMDLEAWTKGPTGPSVRILQDARANADLRAVSLSNFTVELRLAGECISLGKCIGRAELTAVGTIQGQLVGYPQSGRPLQVTFELTDDLHRITVSGTPLPWTAKLMTPTLGESLSGLLDAPHGKLTLANELTEGAGDDNWMLQLDTPLELSRLPQAYGLGEITGKLAASLRACGRLGRTARCHARLRLDPGTTGTLSDVALRNLTALLWGEWAQRPEENRTHTFDALELSFIVTPNFICLTRKDGDPPTGIFGPGGTRLLPGPTGEFTTIGEFLDRLDRLRRLWKEEHSS